MRATYRPTVSVFFFLSAISIMISGVAAAGEITDPSHDKQVELIRQLYGTNMTTGEFMKIVYPEEIETLQLQLSREDFDEFSSQKKYWGDDYPTLPYGANIWTESGPLNLSALNRTERDRYGIQNAIIGGDGYRILDYLDWQIKTGEPVSFYRHFPDGMENISCDLNWIDTESSLKIMIFGPDGMMGPYYDSSDGKEDGRISLRIFREGGLTGGDWYVVTEAEHTAYGKPQAFRLLFY
ncbi:MAG: hypothetical protein WC525_06660 [Candidatus Thermoplasmatota archaeon]